jgi:hypothetical protein
MDRTPSVVANVTIDQQLPILEVRHMHARKNWILGILCFWASTMHDMQDDSGRKRVGRCISGTQCFGAIRILIGACYFVPKYPSGDGDLHDVYVSRSSSCISLHLFEFPMKNLHSAAVPPDVHR